MSKLLLSNFALHVILSPEEEEQVIAAVQHDTVSKRSVLLTPGEVERRIYFVN